jgi:hypothetical protein
MTIVQGLIFFCLVLVVQLILSPRWINCPGSQLDDLKGGKPRVAGTLQCSALIFLLVSGKNSAVTRNVKLFYWVKFVVIVD